MLYRLCETCPCYIHPVGQEASGCQFGKYGFSMIGCLNERWLTRSFPQLTQGTWHDVGWVDQHTIFGMPCFGAWQKQRSIRRPWIGSKTEACNISCNSESGVSMLCPPRVPSGSKQCPCTKKIAVGGIVPVRDIVARTWLPFPSHQAIIADRQMIGRPTFYLLKNVAISVSLRKQKAISLTLRVRDRPLMLVYNSAGPDITLQPTFPKSAGGTGVNNMRSRDDG